jgi:hypothetical protein
MHGVLLGDNEQVANCRIAWNGRRHVLIDRLRGSRVEDITI